MLTPLEKNLLEERVIDELGPLGTVTIADSQPAGNFEYVDSLEVRGFIRTITGDTNPFVAYATTMGEFTISLE